MVTLISYLIYIQLQGLAWYIKRLFFDCDGDVANEFLVEKSVASDCDNSSMAGSEQEAA